MSVTVAIPVSNGARYLDEVLTAVRAQRVDREVELLIVDSGSTDGSLEIAERHGARMHRIPKREFSHGGTRNLDDGARARASTSRSSPRTRRRRTTAGWPRCSRASSRPTTSRSCSARTTPRPDACHMIKAEMERHFATWGDGGRGSTCSGSSASPHGLAAYRAFPGRWTFFSDVNGCVARWAWQRIPYREVPYAEDQLLGREMIEAGLRQGLPPRGARAALARLPAARSSCGATSTSSARCARCSTTSSPPGRVRTPLSIRAARSATTSAGCAARACDGRALRAPLAVSAATTRSARPARSSARAPTACRRRLRAHALARGPRLVHAVRRARRARCCARRAGRTPRLDADWPLGVRPRSLPGAPVRAEPHAADAPRPVTLAWVVPPWRVGSGGHTTIFRLIRAAGAARPPLRDLRLRPVRPRAPLAPPSCASEIREHFVPRRGRGVRRPRRLRLGATSHRDRVVDGLPGPRPPGCREKVYLVQDHEPEFYRHLGRSRSGPRRPTGWATAASPTRRGWPTSCASRYGLEAALVRVRHRPRHLHVRRPGGAASRA